MGNKLATETRQFVEPGQERINEFSDEFDLPPEIINLKNELVHLKKQVKEKQQQLKQAMKLYQSNDNPMGLIFPFPNQE